MKPVRTGYSVAMPPSKHNFKRKQQLIIKIGPRAYKQRSDKDTRIFKSHCDLCNDELPKEADNIQYRINVLDEIDDSYESEYDKHEPPRFIQSVLAANLRPIISQSVYF